MEILNVVGLLLIAITNGWIAVQVRNQKTLNQIEVQPSEIDYDALARAMEASWPTVTVSNDIQIDYDKLAEALAVQPAPNITVQPTVIPSPTPTYPSPYWQSPVVSSEQIDTYQEQEHLITINDGTEVPVRSFPRRANGGIKE